MKITKTVREREFDEFCFVIQPFNGGKFDKRYNDVFKPTLHSIGVDAYRVDEDSAVSIPIETIESKIKDSRFCLADITTDNPNVWYEIGFALASGKEIIFICSNERTNKYPFDIQHRSIISYKTESPSDFNELSKKIISRAKAILQKPLIVAPSVNINAEISGLSFQEITLIGSILTNQSTPAEGVSAWGVKEELKRNGLNAISFNLSIRKLLQKGLIEIGMENDRNDEYEAYFITDKGSSWILENADKFNQKINTDLGSNAETDFGDDDELPF